MMEGARAGIRVWGLNLLQYLLQSTTDPPLWRSLDPGRGQPESHTCSAGATAAAAAEADGNGADAGANEGQETQCPMDPKEAGA